MATYNGTSSNDTLYGSSSNDLLIGGRGNDRLLGQAGNDTYQFSKGDGSDFLQDYDTTPGNIDVVLFTDVRSTEITSVTQSGTDLILKYGVSDQLLINYYFSSPANFLIEQFKFSDGVTWGVADIKSRTVQNGTAASDTLQGYKDGPNTINGLGGDDTIFGGDGNDVLDGGDGNDKIYGQSSGDKILRGGAGNDFLSVYTGTGNNFLDGGSGDDTLYGGTGNDTLDGGSGVNELYGGTGNDTYIISSPTTHIRDDGGTDTAIVNVNFVKVPSNIETVTYATGVQALPYWIDALTYSDSNGSYYKTLLGSGKTITYSFPTSLPAYDTSAKDALGWQPFNEAEKTFARQTLTYIASLVDVRFVESTASNVVNNIAFANNLQTSSEGYSYSPGNDLVGSDLFLNKSADNLNPRDGNYSALTLIHELGHALGLKHPFSSPDPGSGNIGEGPYLPSSEDNSAWTVMSYTSQPAQYQAVYRPLDVATLQYLYGINPSYKPGNDVYVVSATTTNLIYDGGGNDTLDASQQTLDATIFLEPGYWGFLGPKAATITAPGQISINFGTTIENLKSGSGNDFLVGNAADNQIDGGAGNDYLSGGKGNDTLTGGAGNDTLDGGDGFDTAVFSGNQAGYTLAFNGGNVRVSSATESDSLSSIEKLSFADGSLYIANGALFNALRYTASYADLIGAFGLNTDASAAHYISNGFSEGRAVNFDALRYTASYGDLIGAFGTNAQAATAHYITNGFSEGRAVNFDALRYTASYGDLIGAFGINAQTATSHYITNGFSEGRSVSFDAVQYALSNSDLLSAFGFNQTALIQHYIRNGFGEGRSTLLGTLSGTNGADVLSGDSQNNFLLGLNGNDVLNGQAGNDLLAGGNGADRLTGGSGTDVFRYFSAAEGGDTVVDFSPGIDKFVFTSSAFGNLALGVLSNENFANSSNALGNRAGFVYDIPTGQLGFDADGAGAANVINIALVGVSMIAADIVIVG